LGLTGQPSSAEMVFIMSGYRWVEVALLFQVSGVPAFRESRPFDMARQYELAVLTAPVASESEMAAFLSASWTLTIRTLMVPERASEYDSVPTLGADAPLFPLAGGVSKTCGIGSVFPPAVAVALGDGAGATGVCAISTDEAGVGTLAAVDGAAGPCATDGAALAAGAGVGADQAGESEAAVREAREMTSVATSAVVFRIEFTVCLS
jgi:hypothetical protein